MIFLKPNNFPQFFFQFIINIFFRLRVSIKKKISYNVRNNFFVSGEFFESLVSLKKKKKRSDFIFSTLNELPNKKDYWKYKNKIWIFHNSDETFNLQKKKKLEFFKPKKCFSQNLVFYKKRYHFLPIGLENSKFQNNGDINDFLKLRKVILKKKPRVLFGFNIRNLRRKKIRDYLKKLEITDETSGWNSYIYRRILLSYMYVVCPEGNGIDTHRFWEALYLRTIPIIKKNQISSFLIRANLPILVLNNWSDLNQLEENQLLKIYSFKKKLFNSRYLKQEYWKNLFRKL